MYSKIQIMLLQWFYFLIIIFDLFLMIFSIFFSANNVLIINVFIMTFFSIMDSFTTVAQTKMNKRLHLSNFVRLGRLLLRQISFKTIFLYMGLEKGDSKNLTPREHRKQNINIGTHFLIPKNVEKPKVVFLLSLLL